MSHGTTLGDLFLSECLISGSAAGLSDSSGGQLTNLKCDYCNNSGSAKME